MTEASKDYRLGLCLGALRMVHEIMEWHHECGDLGTDLIGALERVTEEVINEASPDVTLVLNTQTTVVSEADQSSY